MQFADKNTGLSSEQHDTQSCDLILQANVSRLHTLLYTTKCTSMCSSANLLSNKTTFLALLVQLYKYHWARLLILQYQGFS